MAQACLFLVLVYFVTLQVAALFARYCAPGIPEDQRGRFCPPVESYSTIAQRFMAFSLHET